MLCVSHIEIASSWMMVEIGMPGENHLHVPLTSELTNFLALGYAVRVQFKHRRRKAGKK